MATLWEVLTEVKDIVRRPDLDALVNARVIAAIRACHAVAPCDRDLIEVDVVVDGGLPVQIGTAEFSNDFRTLERFVHVLNANDEIVARLEKHSTSEISKLRRMFQDTDTFYIANNKISFKSSVPASKLLITGYSHCPPPSLLLDPLTGAREAITELGPIGTYTDWILQAFDIAIIDYAVGYIEGMQGNSEIARLHRDIFEFVDRQQLLAVAATISGK